MHLAGREAALEVATTHVQGLTLAGLAHTDGVGRDEATAGRDPGVMVTDEDLEVVLADLLAAPGNVGLLLAGHHLRRQHLAIVVGTTHIDGILVGIVASKDGARWQGSVNVGANPGVVCKQVEYLEQG